MGNKMAKSDLRFGWSNAVFAMIATSGVLATPLAAFAEMDTPREQRHRINLNDVEIADLIEDVSIVTGYTFIVHPQVRGRVTVTSQTPLTTSEVFDVFLSTLRVHQFVAVPAGDKTYKIVPVQTASGDAGISARGDSDQSFVTKILKLDFFNAVDAAQMIKPVINPAGQVVANKNSNTLVVVDYASNMKRVQEIVTKLDEDKTSVETIALKNIPAKEMEGILNGLGTQYAMNFTAISADSTNAIVIRGDELGVKKAMTVAKKLDATERVRDNIRVLPLSNAKASEIVPVLERLSGALSDQKDLTNSKVRPTISAHEQTNTLVISADYDMLNAMERVVAALDVRRPQVMVEALVVEMSDDAVDELGLQFIVSGTDGEIPFASTNYSRSAPNILALTGALISDGGLDPTNTTNTLQSAAISSLLGLEGLTIGGGGVSGDTLFGVILNAVQSDVKSNILSTPMLMAVDNEMSSITVGQEIPVTTGETVGTDLANSFVTVERKDVGVRLDMVPQIGDGDTVKLKIYQEASAIAGSASSGEIITNKRSIDTTVIADDGEIIVLGGLIEQTRSISESRVPFLGDMPGIGPLFRSRGKANAKTNLMVFIRPSIVRNSEDARMTTSQKYRYIKAQELLVNENDPSVLDKFVNDVLGVAPPKS